MNSQEILDYNRRCVEFLGWRHQPKVSPHDNLKEKFSNLRYFKAFNTEEPRYGNTVFLDELKYHSDWNWIMGLVGAINKTQNPRQGGDTTHSTLKREIQALLGKAAKEAAVQAINQFLIWYEKAICNQ